MIRRLFAFLVLAMMAPLAMAGESIPTYTRLDDGPVVYRPSLSDAIAANWNTAEWQRLSLGSGMTASQSSGSAIITTGTTANAETVFRLQRCWAGDFSIRGKVTLSQRIVNNNFFVEAVDLIGDGLSCTINSAISITVTLPTGYPAMTAADVGKSLTVGVISGAAGVPGRYAIASVDTTGRLVNLTVAGWPVSGSCTLSAWGLNSYRMLYTSTTATNVAFDSYNNGYGSGDTTLTINTTASGHIFNLMVEDTSASYLDTTTNSLSWTQRGQRIERMPDNNATMVLQIRALNGTTNPASGTTFTLGELSVEHFRSQVVSVSSQKALGGANGIPTVNIGSNSATNQSMNLAQVAGGTAATNNGTASANTLRVAIASDNTAYTVNLGTGGTGATSIGKARDSAIGATDTGVAILGVRRDTPTAETPVAGDYVVPQVSANGEQWVLTIGAPTTHHLISAASTNATSVKASAGTVNHIVVNNVNAAVRYFKLYNKASAPTVGTDTPVLTLAIPAGSVQSIALGTRGLRLGTGIAYALTTGIAVADTGAVAASEHAVHISYE